MNRQEWNTLVGNEETTDSEWETIHLVYTFHPAIPDFGGKEKILQFFRLGGIGLIRDMTATAKDSQGMEERISMLQERVRAAQCELDAAARAMRELREAYGR